MPAIFVKTGQKEETDDPINGTAYRQYGQLGGM